MFRLSWPCNAVYAPHHSGSTVIWLPLGFGQSEVGQEIRVGREQAKRIWFSCLSFPEVVLAEVVPPLQNWFCVGTPLASHFTTTLTNTGLQAQICFRQHRGDSISLADSYKLAHTSIVSPFIYYKKLFIITTQSLDWFSWELYWNNVIITRLWRFHPKRKFIQVTT